MGDLKKSLYIVLYDLRARQSPPAECVLCCAFAVLEFRCYV